MRAPRRQMRCIATMFSAISSNVHQKLNSVDGRPRIAVYSVFHLSLLIQLLNPSAALVHAASYVDAEILLQQGEYQKCIDMAIHEFDRGVWNDRWPQLAIRGMLKTGQYERARLVLERARKRFSSSLGIRLLAIEVHRFNGETKEANKEIGAVFEITRNSPWRYSSSRDRVALGRFFLEQGEDARQVLELLYDRVRKTSPKYVDVYIATAELALDKNDPQLAIQMLETARALDPFSSDIPYLQARAYKSSDSQKATQALQKCLELNPKHIEAILLQVDNLIDGEQYDRATELLAEVLEVNVHHPIAWAYHAVIAHLQNHFQGEKILRDIAVSTWTSNPEVDHLIGRKLSQRYLFREGSEYQKRTLEIDPTYEPARFHLAQDLLRLGETEKGWSLAHEANKNDGYNVVAFNLVTLHDELKKFASISDEHFVVRMDAREARIYGDQVLALLNEARTTLCAKYDVQIDGLVTVEIFPRQKDFAIRTFGVPGGRGYLGVCFGRLITANSPASQGGSPANWKSVLWHEYCHVVTLEKTRNRMPRWLSEGISVYEERLKNSAWGERLTPQYQQMILGNDLTQVSELSSAFMRPPSGAHLQFAYYQSSLVVEFLINQHGMDVLKKILDDLAVGLTANEAIGRYAGGLASFEKEFEKFAVERARALAPELDFTSLDSEPIEIDEPSGPRRIRPARRSRSETDLKVALENRPNNYWAMQELATIYIRSERWAEAEAILNEVQKKFPNDRSTLNATRRLASIKHKRESLDEELELLSKVETMFDRDLDLFERLATLQAEREDWKSARQNALRYLAVQPLLPTGHEILASASQQLGRLDEVANARKALLEMEPVDPAESHFRLAETYERLEQLDKAKRQVLMALEFAPRYRAAQELLLRIVDRGDSPTDVDRAETNAKTDEPSDVEQRSTAKDQPETSLKSETEFETAAGERP